MRDIDHVMINAEGRIDDAVAFYSAIGFKLTAPSHEPRDFKRRIMFPTDYVTLFGHRPEYGTPAPDPRGLIHGLTGLALKSEDIEGDHQKLVEMAVPVDKPGFGKREIRHAAGTDTARFGTMRLSKGVLGESLVFLCQHIDGDAVWRHESVTHDNGVTGVADVVFVSGSTADTAGKLGPMAGGDPVEIPGGFGWVSRGQRILVLDAATASGFFKMVAAPGSLPVEGLLGVTFRTHDVTVARGLANAAGLDIVEDGERAFIIRDPASGTLLKFRQGDAP